MATHRVRLRRDGGSELTDLSPVCMKCGDDATRSLSKRFFKSWKRQRVAMPLCEKHWFRLRLLRYIPYIYLGAIFSVIIALSAFAIIVQPGEQVMNYLWGGCWVVIVLYVIVRYWLQYRWDIRASYISDTFIELTNVSLPFVDAVEEEAEALRRKLTQSSGDRFDASPPADERMRPGGGDAYQAE